ARPNRKQGCPWEGSYMIRRLSLATLAATCLAGAACFNFTTTVTAPSGTAGATAALVGGWHSTNSASPNAASQTCTNFQWSVTQTSGNTATGTFTATCFGDTAVSGTANGSLSNSVLTWSANATAVIPGITTCAISLSGTAQYVGDTIQIPYTGTSCFGALSGT